MDRELIFYKGYFIDFYSSLDERTQEKFDFLLLILKEQKVVPTKYVKHLTNTNGLYELRASIGTNEYRVIFFFEDGDLISGGKIVILGNGFLKKSEKDYKKAIETAHQIQQEYFKDKTN